MARLPQPGGDAGNWGEILNEFLTRSHTTEGELKSDTVGAAQLQSRSVTNEAIVDASLDQSKIADLPSSLAAKYAKPINGIPRADLDGPVQAALDKAEVSLNTTQVKATIATDIVTFGSATRAAVSSVLPGNTIVILGDSIAGGSGTGGKQMNYFELLTAQSNQRLHGLANLGVGGETVQQVATRIGTVIALHPAWCIVQCGTNNTGQDMAATKTAYLGIINALSTASIRVIIGLIPPRTGQITANDQWVHNFNDWLRLTANTYGLPILDVYTPCVNPNGGGYKTGYSVDSVHPTWAAIRAICSQAMIDLLPLFPPNAVYLGNNTTANNRDNNLLNNPMLLTPDGNGLAQNFQRQLTGGAVVCYVEPDAPRLGAIQVWTAAIVYAAGAKVKKIAQNGFIYRATTNGTSGSSEPAWPTTVGATVVDNSVTWVCEEDARTGRNWQWFDVSVVPSSFSLSQQISSSWWSPGDVMEINFRLSCKNCEAGNAGYYARLDCAGGSPTTVTIMPGFGADVTDVLHSQRVTISPGTTSVSFRWGWTTGTGALGIAQPTVMNLTRLGLL